jgi:hypothetical protein
MPSILTQIAGDASLKSEWVGFVVKMRKTETEVPRFAAWEAGMEHYLKIRLFYSTVTDFARFLG